jgi:hypothetical protein
MASPGILRRMALVRTDVSEERSVSFVRVTRIRELGTTLVPTSNRRNPAWRDCGEIPTGDGQDLQRLSSAEGQPHWCRTDSPPVLKSKWLILAHLLFLRNVSRLLVTASVFPTSSILVTLMMEALSSSETSFLTRATQRNIPEVAILHSHSRENLKSYMGYINNREISQFNAGTPQSSVLRPLSYLIYTADLQTSTESITAVSPDYTAVLATDSTQALLHRNCKPSQTQYKNS